MSRKVCKRCNSVFEGKRWDYCDKCYEKNEKDYNAILEYLEKYPDAIVLEIIDKTGVSLKTLNRFVDEGGFSYKESNVKLDDIESGEYLKIINRILKGRGKFHSNIIDED